MIGVRKNYHELITDSKRTRDSAIRFCDCWLGGSKEAEIVSDLFAYLVPLLKDLIIAAQ
jgi:hypothetical protein